MAWIFVKGKLKRVKLPKRLPKHIIEQIENNRSAEEKTQKLLSKFKKAKVEYCFEY